MGYTGSVLTRALNSQPLRLRSSLRAAPPSPPPILAQRFLENKPAGSAGGCRAWEGCWLLGEVWIPQVKSGGCPGTVHGDGARMGCSCTPPIRKSREPGSAGTMQQVTANLKTRTRLGDVCTSLNLQMNKCEKGFNPPPSLQSAKACDRRPILCWCNAEST